MFKKIAILLTSLMVLLMPVSATTVQEITHPVDTQSGSAGLAFWVIPAAILVAGAVICLIGYCSSGGPPAGGGTTAGGGYGCMDKCLKNGGELDACLTSCGQ